MFAFFIINIVIEEFNESPFDNTIDNNYGIIFIILNCCLVPDYVEFEDKPPFLTKLNAKKAYLKKKRKHTK